MRNGFLVGAAAVLLCVAETPAVDFGGGGFAGLCLSRFWGDDADLDGFDEGLVPGFTAGGYLEIRPVDFFALEPQLVFAMKGTKWEYDMVVLGSSYHTEIAVKSRYLEFPVLLRLRAPLDLPVNPYGHAGVSLGVLLDAETETDVNGDVTTDESDGDYETFEIGLPLGAGVAFEAGPGSIFVEFRLSLGLSVIDQEDNNGHREEWRNNTVSFLAGYGF